MSVFGNCSPEYMHAYSVKYRQAYAHPTCRPKTTVELTMFQQGPSVCHSAGDLHAASSSSGSGKSPAYAACCIGTSSELLLRKGTNEVVIIPGLPG